MRKITVFTTIMLITAAISFSSHLFTAPTEAFGQTTRKVLMITREGYSTDLDLMIKMEVGVMTVLRKMLALNGIYRQHQDSQFWDTPKKLRISNAQAVLS